MSVNKMRAIKNRRNYRKTIRGAKPVVENYDFFFFSDEIIFWEIN